MQLGDQKTRTQQDPIVRPFAGSVEPQHRLRARSYSTLHQLWIREGTNCADVRRWQGVKIDGWYVDVWSAEMRQRKLNQTWLCFTSEKSWNDVVSRLLGSPAPFLLRSMTMHRLALKWIHSMTLLAWLPAIYQCVACLCVAFRRGEYSMKTMPMSPHALPYVVRVTRNLWIKFMDRPQ